MRKLLFILTALSSTVVASAQTPNYYFFPSLKLMVGDGRSYSHGYETADLFFAFSPPASPNYFFADIELHRVEPGRFAGNVGIGGRMFSLNCVEMLGVNLFYDYRRYLQTNLHQLGVGFEGQTSLFDLRVNGYIPFGKKQAVQSHNFIDMGDNYYAIEQQCQTALWGLDIEIGRGICCRKICTYIGFGPYFYSLRRGDPTSAILGGMGRVSITPFRNFDVEFRFTYDPYFKAKPQVQLCWNIPLPSFSCSCTQFPRIERNPIIVTSKTCSYDTNY